MQCSGPLGVTPRSGRVGWACAHKCTREGPNLRANHSSGFASSSYILSAMTDFANAFLLVYAGLFPILNPIGSTPIFLGLTSSCTEAERNALARRVAINSVLLLAGSMFIGTHLLVFFGITLPVVRIAGGLVLIAFGWKLLHGGAELEDQPLADAEHSAAVDSFYPLTMPLTVGPGSMSVAIALGSQWPAGSPELSQLAILGGSAIA